MKFKFVLLVLGVNSIRATSIWLKAPNVFIAMLQVSRYSTAWQTTKNDIGLLFANTPAEVIRAKDMA